MNTPTQEPAILQRQAVFFLRNFATQRTTEKLGALMVAISKKFNGDDPFLLTIPDDAPADIPRLTMNKADGSLGLSVAQSRVVLTWNNPVATTVEKSQIIEEAQYILGQITKCDPDYGEKIDRVAIVINSVQTEKSTGAVEKRIANQVLGASLAQNCTEFTVTATTEHSLGEHKCFHIMGFMTGEVNRDGRSSERAVLLTSDLSTDRGSQIDISIASALECLSLQHDFAGHEVLLRYLQDD